MKIAEQRQMTEAEIQAFVDKMMAESKPPTPEESERIERLVAVYEAGWHHGLGEAILADTERDALIAATISPDLARAFWADGIEKAKAALAAR